MKTLLVLTLLCIYGMQQIKAQTKEETVAFIAKCMNEAIGLKTYGSSDGERLVEYLFEKNIFGVDEIIKKEKVTRERRSHYQYSTITALPWENVTRIRLDTIPDEFKDSDVALIKLSFSSKYRQDDNCENITYNVDCQNTYYSDLLTLIIPKSRGIATEKAFRHLVELYKKENKDPF